ncbi:hypothetical protein [Cognatilysobacter bugurensis]|uniref:Uncharacterized protein n=1 Tax=Cognatilysobacter bugurensis TaxID=543356 RepID=A0A918T2C7_9GAMM|nr:hypothetical protein [Lysobacter bugurensis]GHA86309.1 hypothetical protein GCM10007067_25450 [Lysobacter bugurensis]
MTAFAYRRKAARIMPACRKGRMFGAAVAAAALLAGCERTEPLKPLPTVEADGTLSIPPDYRPRATSDASRVDCEGYFAMNPPEVRAEARRLCASSSTPAERERNPYCRIDQITVACSSRAMPPAG